MKKKIGSVYIGEGIPKVCVPITGADLTELLEECKAAKESAADLVEWRVDYFNNAFDTDKVLNALVAIKEILGDLPLIFSFRTKDEGGEKAVDQERYITLNKLAAASGYVDAIDIELFQGEKVVTELISSAEVHRVTTIISNHDFEKTPPIEELHRRVDKAIEYGGDVPKLAVMPKSEEDVLVLLETALRLKRQYPGKPFIMISMGGLGMVSRFSGEVFGSAITFASLKNASAPGQISVEHMKTILELIHFAK